MSKPKRTPPKLLLRPVPDRNSSSMMEDDTGPLFASSSSGDGKETKRTFNNNNSSSSSGATTSSFQPLQQDGDEDPSYGRSHAGSKRKTEGDNSLEPPEKKQAPDKHPWTFTPRKPDDNMRIAVVGLSVDSTYGLKLTSNAVEAVKGRIQQATNAADDHVEHLYKETGFRPAALGYDIRNLQDIEDRHLIQAFITTEASGYWASKFGFLFVEDKRKLPWNKEFKPYCYDIDKDYRPKALFLYPHHFTVYQEKGTFIVPLTKEGDLPDVSKKHWTSPGAIKAGVSSRFEDGKLDRFVNHIYENKGAVAFDSGEPEHLRIVLAEVVYTIPLVQIKEIQAVAGKRILDMHPLYKRALLAKAIANPKYGKPILTAPNVREIVSFVQSKYKT